MCDTDPVKFYDLDFFYFQFTVDDSVDAEKAYADRVKEKTAKYDVVFINHICEDLRPDIAFIQDDYTDCIERLSNRKQGNFLPQKEEYDRIRGCLPNICKTIFLNKGEYIIKYREELK